MSYVYAGSDVNATSVTLPSDGDPKDAASVDVPFEAIWDRLTHLNAPEQSGTPYPFPAAGISLTRMQRHGAIPDLASNWFQIPFLDVWITTVDTPVQLVVPLHLGLQSRLDSLTLFVSAGSGHGALPVTGDRPSFSVYEYEPATQTSLLIAGPIYDLDPPGTIGDYEGPHAISTIFIDMFPDPINKKYFVTLTTEGGANAEVGYRFDGCQTSSTIYVQDPE